MENGACYREEFLALDPIWIIKYSYPDVDRNGIFYTATVIFPANWISTIKREDIAVVILNILKLRMLILFRIRNDKADEGNRRVHKLSFAI